MLKELFQEQQTLVNEFFENIDLAQAEKLMELFLNCKGTIIFTGIGKSGIVAKKIAMTLLSTGTKSFYISPLNALHGDIGMLNEEDIFVIFSKSGESDELLQLIPYVRNRGAFLVSMTSNPEGRVVKACDFQMTLPLRKELCPFNLAPTTSASIQLLFGDVIATALMRKKDYSLDQYALNHPAGRIGKRISMKVKDLMIQDEGLPLCKKEEQVRDVLVELSSKRCGCLLVVDEEKKIDGIFTDGDLRRALEEYGAATLDKAVSELMTKDPKEISPLELAWNALKLMEADQKRPVSILPVVEKQSLVGLIKMHDIIQSGV